MGLLKKERVMWLKQLALMQVRRGADRAEIYSLAFCPNAHWLAASSDKGTIHVFGLKVDSRSPTIDNLHPVPQSNRSNSNSSAMSSFKFIRGKTLIVFKEQTHK